VKCRLYFVKIQVIKTYAKIYFYKTYLNSNKLFFMDLLTLQYEAHYIASKWAG